MKKHTIKFKRHQKHYYLLYSILGIILLFGVWHIISLKIQNEIILPYISTVFKSLFNLFTEDLFFKNLTVSITRTLLSFSICFVLVIVLALLITKYELIGYVYKPISALIISLPPMILVVLIMIWTSKALVPVILGIIITFPLLFEQTIKALQETKEKTSDLVSVYEISYKMQLLKLYLPTILFTTLKTFVPIFLITFKMVIAGEVYSYPQYGIGAVIQYERFIFNIPRIYAWLLVIALLSYCLIQLQSLFNKKLFRWDYE